MKRRRAISLVELLAVLTGCSMVLGLTASLLHQTMRTQMHTRRYFEVERNLQRLGQQFRSDIHAAIETSAGGEGDGAELIRIQLGNGRTVEYQRQAEKIVRISSRPASPTAREEYSLSETMVVDVGQEDSPERWVLSITTPPQQPHPESPPGSVDARELPVLLHVEAAIGRNRRHAAAKRMEESI